MSVTLSPPVRVAALVAALVLTGLAATLFLLGRGTGTDTAVPTQPATRPTTPATTPTKGHSPTRPRALTPKSGFPLAVDRALRGHRVVVVAVYVPGAAVDRVVRREARAGAAMSSAGFVAIGASSERALQALVAKTGILPDPAVVVVKRPGIVATVLNVADRQTVAQAVAQARR